MHDAAHLPSQLIAIFENSSNITFNSKLRLICIQTNLFSFLIGSLAWKIHTK